MSIETEHETPDERANAILTAIEHAFDERDAPFNSTQILRFVEYAAATAEEALQDTLNAIALLSEKDDGKTRQGVYDEMLAPYRALLARLVPYSEAFYNLNTGWRYYDSQDDRSFARRIP
jgi:hypothetical protein